MKRLVIVFLLTLICISVFAAKGGALELNPTNDWKAATMPWDDTEFGTLVDVSRYIEVPAGQHGFLQVEDARFVFEDGTPIRFFGIVFSGAANFPTHGEADIIAARLRKFGFNMVRLFHLDAGGDNENLFVKGSGHTRSLDEEKLDRLHYLIYALKNNGIYIYLDNLVSREYLRGDGVVKFDAVPRGAKGYIYVDDHLVELQKEYSYHLWTSLNPYTGLRLFEDPVIALTSLVNENDPWNHLPSIVEPYRTEMEKRWQIWLDDSGISYYRLDPSNTSDPNANRFFAYLQKELFLELSTHLRSVGVRIPINGTNWARCGADLVSQSTMDFMDSHMYWDHYDHNGLIRNDAMVSRNGREMVNTLSGFSFSAQEGKPFVASEWGHPWPNEYRAEGLLWVVTMARFQEWDGLILFNYRHKTALPVERISGPFEMVVDPAYFGLLPTAANLFYRDGLPAQQRVSVKYTLEDLLGAKQLSVWNSPPNRTAVGYHQVRWTIEEPKGDIVLGPTESLPRLLPIMADTQQITHDVKNEMVKIDTDGTVAVLGFVGGKSLSLGPVEVIVDPDFAVISLTAVDQQCLHDARRMLLTTIGRAENSKTVYDNGRRKLLLSGFAPVVAEPITGCFRFPEPVNIYALDLYGRRERLLLDAGTDFTVTLDNYCLWYEVVAPY